MFNASLNFPSTLPAVLRYAVTDDRRQLLINPQLGSFENLNSVRYPEDNCPSAPSQITSIVRPNVGYDKSDFVGLKMYEDQFDHKLTERRFGLHLLYPRVLARRSTEEIMSLAGFGLAASVAATAAWLEASLNELEECSACAVDEGLEEPSELGLTKARKLLETVSTRITNRPDIYPMDEGSIAIDFRNPESKSGVLFLVEQDGSGVLFHRTKSSKGRLRVDDAADLLREGGFLELDRVGIR